jgi:hypothetical protein
MLKSFSAQTNPLGAINFKGTWNASTNTPTLTSSVGTNGDYYVVSVTGSTTLNGISNWGVGDWAVFNGSVWQRVEGGADVNAVNLTVSGNTTLSGPVSVTPTWNAGGTTFTGIGLNVTDTASAAASLLLDLQVGGTSQFKVSKGGKVTAQTLTIGLGGQTSVATNTALGFEALNSASLTGVENTGVGYQALRANTTGNYNSAVGRDALYNTTTGSNNSAVGVSALYSNTTGANNTAIGLEAGYGDGTQANSTGSNNTFIGFDAMGASATADNVITLGNASIATLRCQVTTITALSDARDKTNIVDIPAGLAFVQALRPVSFDWNMRNGAKVGVPEFGFIAQELQSAQESTGITIPNLVSTENPDKLEASAGTLIPVLVKAIQELKAEFDAYKLTHP